MSIRALLAAIALLVPGLALAEETVCTPEFYVNTWDNPPFVVPIDAPRRSTARKTSVDLETGAWHQNFVEGESDDLGSGTFTIVNPGSLRERIHFVAIDPAEGTMLRISLIDDGLPFTMSDPEGTISTGHCVYEYDQ